MSTAMSTDMGTVNSEATSTSNEGSNVASPHHSILSDNLSSLHEMSPPSAKLDSLPLHATPDDPLVAQAHASDPATRTHSNDLHPSPSTSTFHHSHHLHTRPPSVVSPPEPLEVGQESEPHQQSLEGILAMIESAVYPHCVAESSPAGSGGSPCNGSPRLEKREPSKGQTAESIANAGEEVKASAGFASEQVDASKGVSDQPPEIPSARSENNLPNEGQSIPGEKDEGGKEVSEESCTKNDDASGQESSEAPTATAHHETSISNLSPNPILIVAQKATTFDQSTKQGATTTPSSSPSPPIASPSKFANVQPSCNSTLERIGKADVIHEHHPCLSLKEGSATPSASLGFPIASPSRLTDVQPIQEDMLDLIDDTDLTDNSDKHHSRPIQEHPHMVASQPFIVEAASPLLSPSVLTLTSESDKVAEAEQSVACESAILSEKTEETTIPQDPAIGHVSVNPSIAQSPGDLPVQSREEPAAETSEEIKVAIITSNSAADEACAFPLKPKEHEDQIVDLVAKSDDKTDLSLSTPLPTPVGQRSPVEPRNEERELVGPTTVATEHQDIRGEDSSSRQEERVPLMDDIAGNEDPAGSSTTTQQEEGDSIKQTRIPAELSVTHTERALKRRFTSAMFDEPKRRKVAHDTHLESTSLQRFPSGQMLKAVGCQSGKKTGRTFSMPIPEDSVFFNAADATIAGPFPPKMDAMMPSSSKSVSATTALPPGSIPSTKTDSHQANSLQNYASLATSVGNQQEDDVGRNENRNARDNQPSGLNEGMILRETEKQAVVGLAGERNEESFEREGELQSNRPSIALQPPDSGRPAEKAWRTNVTEADSTSKTHVGMSQLDSKQPMKEKAPERPLVIFTRFKRPQVHVPTQPLVGPKACSPPFSRDRLATVGQSQPIAPDENSFPDTPEPRIVETRKRQSSHKDREIQAVKKLKQPFKSPMLARDAVPKYQLQKLATECGNSMDQHRPSSLQHDNVQLPDKIVEESSASGSNTGSQSLCAKRIVTERLANSFSSPFSSPLKAPQTYPGSIAAARQSSISALDQSKQAMVDANFQTSSMMTEISALEKQKHILKQAIKIRSSPDEERRLRDLVSQWRNAGREVAEMLFLVMPKPDPSAGGQAGFSTLWGPEPYSTGTCDEPLQPKAAEREETSEELSEDWNYGAMLRTLQVEPQLLGWDENAEDWID